MDLLICYALYMVFQCLVKDILNLFNLKLIILTSKPFSCYSFTAFLDVQKDTPEIQPNQVKSVSNFQVKYLYNESTS